MEMYVDIALGLVLTALILWGLKLMNSPKTAVHGNRLGALSMLCAIILVLLRSKSIDMPLALIAMAIGGLLGALIAIKAIMIKMPQIVALFNGLGGGASALVALAVLVKQNTYLSMLNRFTGQLALIVGTITLGGSLIAAGKLDQRIRQQPVVFRGQIIQNMLLSVALVVLVIYGMVADSGINLFILVITIMLAFISGVLFTLGVGGADMPIVISLLNSFSGVAAAVCGMVITDPLLVAVGAIVGASGLILTQIMCNAMNRSLLEVLSGRTTMASVNTVPDISQPVVTKSRESINPVELLNKANKVIIVPGYGMALAQAQRHVKTLFTLLSKRGKEVKFAIHPVAGRMPGHMNVLLAEVEIPYEKLCEMDQINEEFSETDVGLVIGACDVVNTAAKTAKDTPIYGMPVLRVEEAKNVIVCNKDKSPGYSGVPNPLYNCPHVHYLEGDAAKTITRIIEDLQQN